MKRRKTKITAKPVISEGLINEVLDSMSEDEQALAVDYCWCLVPEHCQTVREQCAYLICYFLDSGITDVAYIRKTLLIKPEQFIEHGDPKANTAICKKLTESLGAEAMQTVGQLFGKHRNLPEKYIQDTEFMCILLTTKVIERLITIKPDVSYPEMYVSIKRRFEDSIKFNDCSI